MPLRIDQLPAALERGLAPVYLFGGAEPLLVQECRDMTREAATAAGFLEREIMQVERGFDWEGLQASASAPSLFAQRKIIDLRLPTGKPGRDGSKVLTEWAAQPDPDILLIISCEAWDAGSRKAKWSTTIERSGVRVDIWPVKPNELPGWINRRMRAAGLEPEREAVMVLADRLEGNLLAAQQEIEKLVLLKGRGPVTEADVLESVIDSSRFDAFLLVERVLAGNLADGLRVAVGLRRTGVPVQLVTGALARELRMLEVFKSAREAGQDEAGVFRKLNVWRNRQGPVRSAASRLSHHALGNAFERLSVIDRQGKGQAEGDPWHSLDHLVCALCA
jgi:DNA polymerase-3 subunit delta